jgi:hypothetical protein
MFTLELRTYGLATAGGVRANPSFTKLLFGFRCRPSEQATASSRAFQ